MLDRDDVIADLEDGTLDPSEVDPDEYDLDVDPCDEDHELGGEG